MILLLFWIMIFYLVYTFLFYQNIVESFELFNTKEIIVEIKKNYKPITFKDKNSLNDIKIFISDILKKYNINDTNFFLKTFELNSRYVLEVSIIVEEVLNKLLTIELVINNNLIEIDDIKFKENDKILLPGLEPDYNSNFLIPKTFEWKENPVYQNIVVPNSYENISLSGDNLKTLSKNYNLKNKVDIQRALNMARVTLENRKNYYEKGFCFGTKIIGIDNQEDCEKNFGTWDKACTKNEDCKIYDTKNKGRGGCIDNGY